MPCSVLFRYRLLRTKGRVVEVCRNSLVIVNTFFNIFFFRLELAWLFCVTLRCGARNTIVYYQISTNSNLFLEKGKYLRFLFVFTCTEYHNGQVYTADIRKEYNLLGNHVLED